MSQNLLSTIKNNIISLQGQRVIVGVSGGADSMALLGCLRQLADELALSVVVAHLEHGFRGQASIEDAKYVEQYCAAHDIAFEMKSVNMPEIIAGAKGSSQELSREVRYSWYRELTIKYQTPYVLLGHHRDDQVETIIMRMIQGTSISGLAGMNMYQQRMGMTIVRPLLEVTKEQLIRHCREMGIVPREDSSNYDNKYLRNRVRNQLLPLLEEQYNPNVAQALLNLANLAREDSDFIEQHVGEVFADIVTEVTANQQYKIERKQIRNLHPALQSRVILLILYYLKSDTRFEKKHIHIVIDWINEPFSGGILQLAKDIVVVREAEYVLITYREFLDSRALEEPLLLPLGERIELPDGGYLFADVVAVDDVQELPVSDMLVKFDADQLHNQQIYCRGRQDGDRMSIWGMKGSKKVKNIFIDAKIPAHERNRIPVIVAGEEIIWLAGIQRSSCAPVTEATKRVFYLEYKKKQ